MTMIISTAGSIEAQNLSRIDTSASDFNNAAAAVAHVNRLTLPITYSGNMNIALYSISLVDARAMALECRRKFSVSSANQRPTMSSLTDNAGRTLSLAVGDGLLFSNEPDSLWWRRGQQRYYEHSSYRIYDKLHIRRRSSPATIESIPVL